jgi:hypothetical protein
MIELITLPRPVRTLGVQHDVKATDIGVSSIQRTGPQCHFPFVPYRSFGADYFFCGRTLRAATRL